MYRSPLHSYQLNINQAVCGMHNDTTCLFVCVIKVELLYNSLAMTGVAYRSL